MKTSHLLAAAATLACGVCLSFAATPALLATPNAAPAAVTAPQRRRMSPAQRAKFMVARINKAVGLNADQQSQMEAIYEKAYTQQAQAFQNGDRAGARKIGQQATKDAQALLTSDQLAKWPKPRYGRGGGGR
ncbi:MAG: hypothetical protein ACRD04_12865 [Terriglobales bacterium]